jgi:hypothetical protein
VPRLRSDTTKGAMRYGPFKLPSANEMPPAMGPIPAEKGALQAFSPVEGLCSDCFVVRSTTYIEYANGSLATPADGGVYNHHAVIFELGKTSVALDCEKKTFSRAVKGMSTFAASAADAGALSSFKAGAMGDTTARGHYVSPGTKMMMVTELMNYRVEPQEVYIVAEAEYFSGKPAGFMETSGVGISVNGCDQQLDFVVTSPQYSKSSPEFTVPKDVLLTSMSKYAVYTASLTK